MYRSLTGLFRSMGNNFLPREVSGGTLCKDHWIDHPVHHREDRWEDKGDAV